MKIIEMCLFAMLSIVLFLGQVALAPLANVEIVTVLVIVYSIVFRWKTLVTIYLFVLIEGLLYGFGIWWISYLYIWTILMLLTILLERFFKENSVLWAVFAGLYGLLFGTLTAIPQLFIGGPAFALAYIISGLSFDVIHAVSNFIVTLLLFKIIKSVLLMAYTKGVRGCSDFLRK